MESKRICLDEDIILFIILPRLPAKVLSRFKCVSKNWNDIISNNPRFIHLQFQGASASPCLLFKVEGPMPIQIYGDRGSVGFPSLDDQFKRRAWMVVGSCNGILGIACFKRPTNAVEEDWALDLYVGNPVLKDWRLVPNPKHSRVYPSPCLGLVVDVKESVASYKLVLPFSVDDFSASSNIYNPVTECRFEVLSSETGSWEVSEEKIILDGKIWLDQRTVNVTGTLFWKFGADVLWFDPKEECSGLLPLPSDADATKKGKMGEWDGKLSYTTIKDGEIHVWIKNKLSWSKMCSVSFEFIVEQNFALFASLYPKMRLKKKIPRRIMERWLLVAKPLAYERSAILFSMDNLMFSFDIETREARNHGPGACWFAYKHNALIGLPSP